MAPRALAAALAILLGAALGLFGVCGPFTDFTDAGFCPYVLEIFTLGITTGTTPTTYDPSDPVSRLQMAAFLSRGVDVVLKRGSRRAAMSQFASATGPPAIGVTTLPGVAPYFAASDGADLWVPVNFNRVARVRGSDGTLLETWTGAAGAFSAVVALGRVIVFGGDSLFLIDPRKPPGAATFVASGLGAGEGGMVFDGTKFFMAHQSSTNGLSIVYPGTTTPWISTSLSVGQSPLGLVYDGANVWLTDPGTNPGTLLKLDSGGAILQTVTIGFAPQYPGFDGTNILVPDAAGEVAIVRPATGAILATLTGNGMSESTHVAFDGERILVTNSIVNTVSLWRAADLAPLGSFSMGGGSVPWGACSDGVNFWVVLQGNGSVNGLLARF